MNKALLQTLIVSLLVTLLLAQRHCGFMLIFVLLLLLPWLLYASYRCLRFPAERTLRAQQAMIWCIAVAAISASHLLMYQSARSYAQAVVGKVEAYMASHGHCPAGLADIGVSAATFKQQLGIGGYVCDNQKAHLFYARTYVPFDSEHYDFSQHAWLHSGG